MVGLKTRNQKRKQKINMNLKLREIIKLILTESVYQAEFIFIELFQAHKLSQKNDADKIIMRCLFPA